MASAKISARQYVVNLTLNAEETDALLKIMEHVGGDPGGPRGRVDQIYRALRDLGLDSPSHFEISGSIYFD